MLALVDELERNGGSPQHFSRELSRYFRNLLVTQIAGGDSRLIAASPSERAEMTQIAAAFSEEDLTRYLQLSLDLFRDLQFSLQPRFHLEIGLVEDGAGGQTDCDRRSAGGSADNGSPQPRPPIANLRQPPPPPAPVAGSRTAACRRSPSTAGTATPRPPAFRR